MPYTFTTKTFETELVRCAELFDEKPLVPASSLRLVKLPGESFLIDIMDMSFEFWNKVNDLHSPEELLQWDGLKRYPYEVSALIFRA